MGWYAADVQAMRQAAEAAEKCHEDFWSENEACQLQQKTRASSLDAYGTYMSDLSATTVPLGCAPLR